MVTYAFLTIDFASYPDSKFENVRNNMGVTPEPAYGAPAPATTQSPAETTPVTAPPAIKSPTSGGGCDGVSVWVAAKVYTKRKKVSYSMLLVPSPSVEVYLCTLVRWSRLDRQMVGSHLVLSIF